MLKAIGLPILAALIISIGCEPAIIVDATGKEWDVTHAALKYGFDPAGFQYGLGPYAIQPIQNPEMLSPGMVGYPRDDDSFPVLGFAVDGDARAYPISVLRRHEVVDESFGDVHVAVTY